MHDNWNLNGNIFTMSLHLSNVILHQLSKNDQEELIVNYRAESLENDASSESLVAELHRVFNSKAGKGFGSFKSDSEFQQSLHEFRAGEQSSMISLKKVRYV